MDIDMDEKFSEDPYTPFLELRRKSAVIAGRNNEFDGVKYTTNYLLGEKDQDVFLVLGYDAIMQVLKDYETFAAAPAYAPTLHKTLGFGMNMFDPPEHTVYRRIVQAPFTHRSVSQEWLEEKIKPSIQKTFDGFKDRGKGDLLHDFILNFPYQVAAAIYGLSPGDQAKFHKFNCDLMNYGTDPEAAMQATRDMDAIFLPMFAEARKNPKDDFISKLITAEADGVSLTDEQAAQFMRSLIGAGGDTTYRTTSSTVFHLMENPDQMAMLEADHGLIDGAIFEGLRHDMPANSVPRMATRDTELAGVKIPKGSPILVMTGVGNHDETVFENPRKFDITRKRKPILSFGAGPHVCLGMNLAMAELRFAWSLMLENLKNLRKDPEKWDAAKIKGFALRGATTLPVLWDVPADK